MSIVKSVRLGLLHVSIAITFVAINGVLNRVMIYDLKILASLVAVLVITPYILSPLQVWIGQYSDTHPLLGYRRTPYIALGIVLCVGGAVLTPYAALNMGHADAGLSWLGMVIGMLAFGAWGMGYNVAVVSYLSLASDISPEHQRSRTVAIMWFMMITGIIITAILLGRALDPFSQPRLIRVFALAGGVSLALAALGLIGLEPRYQGTQMQSRQSQQAALRAVVQNPQARLFFLYLILMLAAILGQDILLEPFGAQAFMMDVRQTTRLTSAWGGATLLALLLHGVVLHRFLSKKVGAVLGGMIAVVGLLLIAASSLLQMQAIFVPGIVALGFGTGISTATNLGLMLDMTTPEQAGLFMGAWGVADSLARGAGTLLGGVVRDVVAGMTGSASSGYVSVFLIEALLLLISLLLLRFINVADFRSQQPTLTELIALVGEQ